MFHLQRLCQVAYQIVQILQFCQILRIGQQPVQNKYNIRLLSFTFLFFIVANAAASKCDLTFFKSFRSCTYVFIERFLVYPLYKKSMNWILN